MDRIVVVGASTGGVSALTRLASTLPPGFPAAIVAVLHFPPGNGNGLPALLGTTGPLPTQNAHDGESIQPGRIYLAVPDFHLMVDTQRLLVRRGTRENGFRPSVDVLFRSAAYAWGPRAIGVVLSGALDDGASGLHAIKSLGGIALVQDPDDAEYAPMPAHALRRAPIDSVATAEDLGRLLVALAGEPAPSQPDDAAAQRARLRPDIEVALGQSAWRKGIMDLPPSPYTCPDCQGVLFEIREGTGRRFRCHTGHGYTMGSLLTRFRETSENALSSAVRSVEEAVTLMQETVGTLETAGEADAASELRSKIEDAKRGVETLRTLSLPAQPDAYPEK